RLLLFLAGHGTVVGQDYYFLPHDYQPRPMQSREDAIKEQGIATRELSEFLWKGPALYRMLILDTCEAGGAVGRLGGAPDNPFALRQEGEELKRKGIHILAAAAARQEAKESTALRHGILTYALLAGLRAVDLKPLDDYSVQSSSPDQVVSVGQWF